MLSSVDGIANDDGVVAKLEHDAGGSPLDIRISKVQFCGYEK